MIDIIVNKYDSEITSQEAFEKNITRLTNQMWKLIPMRENNEAWDKQLNSVIIDIAGKDEIFLHNSHFLQLLSKLEGLRVLDVEFSDYRKTIFECMNLLSKNKDLEYVRN